MTPDELEDAERMLRAVLAEVEQGNMTATPGLVQRLEGAAIALSLLRAQPGGATSEESTS